MLILALVCIPICGVLLATEKLLLLGGQAPPVAAMTAAYVRFCSILCRAHDHSNVWYSSAHDIKLNLHCVNGVPW